MIPPCDVGNRRLMVADAAKVLLRHLQNAPAHLVSIRWLSNRAIH
ncbi:hypothetical protein X743_15860 [Mesorhizobium sp. LNHC252B00]|nr:hypothetical protein X743_15860 [Mesorhizobium sp. LNHC252B00]